MTVEIDVSHESIVDCLGKCDMGLMCYVDLSVSYDTCRVIYVHSVDWEGSVTW